MNGKEVQLQSIEAVGRQLDLVIEGLSDDGWTSQVNEHTMTPLEIFEHLAACYDMFSAESQGIHKEWGAYQVEDKSPEGVLKAWREERDRAITLFKAGGSDEDIKRAANYITLHDAYHVGQLCSLRLTLDPAWNPYAIYE